MSTLNCVLSNDDVMNMNNKECEQVSKLKVNYDDNVMQSYSNYTKLI